MRSQYQEQHGDIGTPCFWNKSMIHRLKCLSKQLFSELVARQPENHRMIADTQALVTFFDAIMRGTSDGNDFYD